MSTVRIYKVAELLNTTSQEVLALLKKAHGIELKSASSTLEEIVARQFVDRLAKQRNITLPKGDIFSEQAAQAVKTAAKSKATAAKKGTAAPEPAKPAAPTLGPPRLIKKAKPAEPQPDEHHRSKRRSNCRRPPRRRRSNTPSRWSPLPRLSRSSKSRSRKSPSPSRRPSPNPNRRRSRPRPDARGPGSGG